MTSNKEKSNHVPILVPSTSFRALNKELEFNSKDMEIWKAFDQKDLRTDLLFFVSRSMPQYMCICRGLKVLLTSA